MAEQVFVGLVVAGQHCGVAVGAVRDVLDRPPITPVPLAPPDIAGSLNLRGRIVTAIDLRRRFGVPSSDAGEGVMAVVVEVAGEAYALLADAVTEVLTLPDEARDAVPPHMPPAWARDAECVYRLPDGLLLVLRVDAMFDLARATLGDEG